MGILERWQLTNEELDEIIAANPSLRGMMLGYVSEFKLRQIWFTDPRFQDVRKEDDHDRTRKGDLWFTYQGVRLSVEVKCLQTHKVKQAGESYQGKFQCDASDRREVILPNGEALQTTCLLVGEFDLLAVGLFEFGQQWRFAFAKNSSLPRSTWRNYTPEQRAHLLASFMPITWPLQAPYETTPFQLLNEIIQEKQNGPSAQPLAGVKIEDIETPSE
ncbi:MAG TPA: hypothetical protein VMV29_00485 [Ktedonobacterales bacterium]|nr:hypothetical protein [Ktedonobacterales bacterium]